ncbi:MAG: efflux RND transporter periplasmic adaptor subunit [Bdellovibrionales bacterium]|nr:efflux RND transporter periplasmic adaptor subunit [Bdellovibrionales bacterium]
MNRIRGPERDIQNTARFTVGLLITVAVVLQLLLAVAAAAASPLQISAEKVSLEQHQSFERIPGTVQAKLDANIEARVSGTVKRIAVAEGAAVQAGELLLELQADELQARLRQAQAAADQARKDRARLKQLFEAGGIPRQEYENAETRAQVAQAAVQEAQTLAGYTIIQAPFAGMITRKLVDEGDQALPGKPLLRIEAADVFRFESDVSESIAMRVQLGESVRIVLAGSDEELIGTVEEISPTTDPGTRTRRVKFALATAPLVRSGQYGHALIPLDRRPTVAVPADAVVERGQLEVAFVIRDGKALLRLVRTGKRTDGKIEILSGLSEGEVIATSHVGELRDGASVEVLP